jgi:hypothetical protein
MTKIWPTGRLLDLLPLFLFKLFSKIYLLFTIEMRQIVNISQNVLLAALVLFEPQLKDVCCDLLLLGAVVLEECCGGVDVVSGAGILPGALEDAAGGFDAVSAAAELHVLDVTLERRKKSGLDMRLTCLFACHYGSRNGALML